MERTNAAEPQMILCTGSLGNAANPWAKVEDHSPEEWDWSTAVMPRKLTSIVAIDIVGYSGLMEADETGTLMRLKDLRTNVFDPAIDAHAGRTVKWMGDGALVDFASVVGAVECAISIQSDLVRRNAALAPAKRLEARIGIHLGDVIVDGDDIYGDGVNVAARLETLASPGGIVLSKQVHDHLGGNVSARLVPIGEQTVKNLKRRIEAFRVELDGQDEPGVIRFNEFELDTGHFQLRRDGEVIAVTPQVFDLIAYLARNAGKTVTREEMFSTIWHDRVVSESALSSQIKAARKALGDDGAKQHIIATVHGRGFRFVPSIKTGAPASETTEASSGEAQPSPPHVLATRPSVAVLPFINMNRDPDEDYLADGIAEDVITALSRHRWLSVIARNPSSTFRNSNEGNRVIGEKLGADYLISGSVRRAGTRVRITVQLIDSSSEHNLWSERFDRDMVDIFSLQDEISVMVAARIESELGLSEQHKANRTPPPEPRGLGYLPVGRRRVL